MNFKHSLIFGAMGFLASSLLINLYKSYKERPFFRMGYTLDYLIKQTDAMDASLHAKLIWAELDLISSLKKEIGKSMLQELISQDINQDVKIKAQLILARHIKNDDPNYANKLFEEVAQQSLNINEQLIAKFFIAEQMILKDPIEAQKTLESILDQAKEIDQDLAFRIKELLAQLIYKSDPERAKVLWREVSNQNVNRLIKRNAEEALKKL